MRKPLVSVALAASIALTGGIAGVESAQAAQQSRVIKTRVIKTRVIKTRVIKTRVIKTRVIRTTAKRTSVTAIAR